MDFKPGDVVALRGFSVPMTVESVSGDEVLVQEWDLRKKTWRSVTYKAGALQPAPRRRPIIPRF